MNENQIQEKLDELSSLRDSVMRHVISDAKGLLKMVKMIEESNLSWDDDHARTIDDLIDTLRAFIQEWDEYEDRMSGKS